MRRKGGRIEGGDKAGFYIMPWLMCRMSEMVSRLVKLLVVAR